MAIVEWDEEQFLDLYPAIAAKVDAGQVTSRNLLAMWEMATAIIDNTDASVIPFDPESGVFIRRIILFAVVCHLVTMAGWDASASGPVASASEGGVSASFQIPQIPSGGVTATWYNQTPCGRMAWMLLRPYSLGGRWYGVSNFHPYG